MSFPPPHTTHNTRLKVAADFQQTTSFIRYREPKENTGEIAGFAELKTAPPVELNLSLEDMKWLRSHPKYGENGDPRFRISENLFERMLYLLELTCGKEDRIITVKEAEDIFVDKLKLYRPSAAEKKHLLPQSLHTTNAVAAVYKYWMSKRNQLSKPILRRYWPPTLAEDINPHMVFRPREKERYRLRKSRRNDPDALQKSLLLKNNFERVKLILNFVRRREQVKRHLLTIRRELFLQKLSGILHAKNTDQARAACVRELADDLKYLLNGGGRKLEDMDSARRVSSYYEEEEEEDDGNDGDDGDEGRGGRGR